VISTTSTPLRLAQPNLPLLRGWTWEWNSSRSRIRRLDWRSLGHQFLLLIFTPSSTFFALFTFLALFTICRACFLFLIDISTNDTEVPEHQVGYQDLFKQRSTSISELDVTKAIDGSFDMYRISSIITRKARGSRRRRRVTMETDRLGRFRSTEQSSSGSPTVGG
jgi:hypothetical protein